MQSVVESDESDDPAIEEAEATDEAEPVEERPTDVADAVDDDEDDDDEDEESIPPPSELIQVCVRVRPLVRDVRDEAEVDAWTWDERSRSLRQTQFPLSMQQRGLRQSMVQGEPARGAGDSVFDRRKTIDLSVQSRPFDPLLDAAAASPYVFDHLITPDQSNEDLYAELVAGTVDRALQGYHGMVFTYGQTSSGKTFTMTGTPRSPGVIPQAVFDMFEKIQLNRRRVFTVTVSYLEVYMEAVRDLFRAAGEGEEVRVLHDPKAGRIILTGLNEVEVSTPQEVMRLLGRGETLRHIGATNMNDKSSRAHTVFRLAIESRARRDPSAPARHSTMSLVDLAGSENSKMTGSTGERQLEGRSINQSLLALSTIIQRLSETNKAFLPFRDSKLTRILQESLQGNSVIVIICTVTPSLRCADESHNTLKFATRAKKVRLAVSEIEDFKDARDAQISVFKKVIDELTKKVEELTVKLSEASAKSPYTGASRSRARAVSHSYPREA